jgi:hypothetical protein
MISLCRSDAAVRGEALGRCTLRASPRLSRSGSSAGQEPPRRHERQRDERRGAEQHQRVITNSVGKGFEHRYVPRVGVASSCRANQNAAGSARQKDLRNNCSLNRNLPLSVEPPSRSGPTTHLRSSPLAPASPSVMPIRSCAVTAASRPARLPSSSTRSSLNRRQFGASSHA